MLISNVVSTVLTARETPFDKRSGKAMAAAILYSGKTPEVT
jgi:hypothetical protein